MNKNNFRVSIRNEYYTSIHVSLTKSYSYSTCFFRTNSILTILASSWSKSLKLASLLVVFEADLNESLRSMLFISITVYSCLISHSFAILDARRFWRTGINHIAPVSVPHPDIMVRKFATNQNQIERRRTQ